MRTVSTTPHHARWRPLLGAILEAGAAIRTRMARLVSGGDHAWDEQLDDQPAWPAGRVAETSAARSRVAR